MTGDVAVAHLNSLLRISTLLQSTREMYGTRGTPAGRLFKQHLLALIQDLLPSDEGSIFLYESEDAPVPSLVDSVLKEELPSFGATEMAVPLTVRCRMAGVIYLKSAQPFDETDFQLLTAISQIASLALENAFHLEWLEGEVKRLEHELGIEEDLPGESRKISELRVRISRAAPTDATVLIVGESGTGKELVARAIHRNSLRAAKPFIAINCAALAETLLESELFGHEKGSFTGAFSQKRGKLECAEGGTVFLDEVGEIPIHLQAKLLRVLQQREVERVGGTRAIKLDFRLVAATNRNLDDAIRQGSFRQDLLYRLNVVTLAAPPLRARPEDILPLAQRFLARFGEKCGRKLAGISPEARALLRAYQWPGNVRELENAIERAVVLGSAEMILPEDLPDCLRESQPPPGSECQLLHDAVNAAKRSVVGRAFEQAEYDHNEAARLLGVHPNYLYRLLNNMDLHPKP